MVTALQAKLIARLLEPVALPWKLFFQQWLFRSSVCRAAHPSLQVRPVDQLGYGTRLIFTTYPVGDIGMPSRQLGYLTAFQALRPHRSCPVDTLSAADIACEPLFFSPRVVLENGNPLQGSAALALASAGVSTVGSLLTAQPHTLPANLHPALQEARARVPAVWVQTVQNAGLQAQTAHAGPSTWLVHPFGVACVCLSSCCCCHVPVFCCCHT